MEGQIDDHGSLALGNSSCAVKRTVIDQDDIQTWGILVNAIYYTNNVSALVIGRNYNQRFGTFRHIFSGMPSDGRGPISFKRSSDYTTVHHFSIRFDVSFASAKPSLKREEAQEPIPNPNHHPEYLQHISMEGGYQSYFYNTG